MKRHKLFDEKSIRVKFWMYFSGMAIFILALLWLLQTVFINSFYKSMKIRDTEKVGRAVTREFGKSDFEDTLLQYSFERNISVQVYNGDGSLVFPLNPLDYMYQPMLSKDDFFTYFMPLLRNNKAEATYVSDYKNKEASSILYVSYLGEQAGERFFLAVTTNVDPVDSTVEILKNQLFIVSIISMIAAFFFSYYLSSRLARPLSDMAKTARALGRGDYNVQFKEQDYTEINDLAKTLNYATGELTEALEMRKDLIANVSHDFKTPLTVIKSYGEMIRDISGDNKELRDRHTQTILEEVDYLTDFVNDLLDLSRVESGLGELHIETFDLKALAEEVLERFKNLKNSGYRFIIHGEGTIAADRNKIRQVIYNFVSNGVNYSRDKKQIDIYIIEYRGDVTFCVRDYGRGIEEDGREFIWDRFYRGRDNHERQIVGTGLGLFICKNILELHGFEYGVKSEVDVGSTFYFRGPRKESESTPAIEE
ncbi:MAG: HAMP domain-containing sensor histidine kinase [Peptoniphilus sp.]|nr:HAMP domain-containing sensor histidine kinase [Peptoniphilus sp.]MDD7363709.1 HAMP domain-containing sensor histidine kinase [Bacillota bacterium]MDY6044094.1 HAMP domain-containing sensor histidine kinase [Peptoniphilus sp.]